MREGDVLQYFSYSDFELLHSFEKQVFYLSPVRLWRTRAHRVHREGKIFSLIGSDRLEKAHIPSGYFRFATTNNGK